MAAPQCMSGDGNQAVFVGTMLQTGDAVALCEECLVPWGAALLGAMTGLDMEPFLLAASADTATDDQVAAAEHANDQGAPEAAPPTGRRPSRNGRTSRASQEAGMETDLDADGPASPTDEAIPAA